MRLVLQESNRESIKLCIQGLGYIYGSEWSSSWNEPWNLIVGIINYFMGYWIGEPNKTIIWIPCHNWQLNWCTSPGQGDKPTRVHAKSIQGACAHIQPIQEEDTRASLWSHESKWKVCSHWAWKGASTSKTFKNQQGKIWRGDGRRWRQ